MDTCSPIFVSQLTITRGSSSVPVPIFTFRAMHVDVDTTAGVSFGRTVHDIWHLSGKPRNVQVAMDADSPRFFDLLRRCISRLR